MGSSRTLGFAYRKLEAHEHTYFSVLMGVPGFLTIAVRQLDGPCGGQNSELIVFTQEQQFLHVSRFKAFSRVGTPGHRRDRGCASPCCKANCPSQPELLRFRLFATVPHDTDRHILVRSWVT